MHMTEATPQVVRSYLRDLDTALHGMPAAVRQEILGGVREELTGLDETAAAQRIAELGDAEFIAAEAREAAGDTPPTGRDSFGYALAASLLVAFGGIVVPVFGWVVGLGMVWFSRTWRTGEKLIATFLPPALGLVALGATSLIGRMTSGAGGGPPVFGTAFDLAHASILLVPVANIGVGLWLLARARGRFRSRT